MPEYQEEDCRMAEKIHTHYDNLKVTRNAPLEVIKAAYKAMAQKFHPDRNPGRDAERVMKLVNEAWDVLSDTNRRAEHDRWIIEQESVQKMQAQRAKDIRSTTSKPADSQSGFARQDSMRPNRQSSSNKEPGRPTPSAPYAQSAPQTSSSQILLLFGVVGLVLFITYRANQGSKAEAPTQIPASEPTKDVRSVANNPPFPPANTNFTPSPNTPSKTTESTYSESRGRRALLEYGQAIPQSSGPILGSMQTTSTGLSTVTIDNSQNNTDVVLKLCDGAWTHCLPARHIFIARGDRFTMRSISPGSYDIRYVSLDSGALSKSQTFELEEIETTQGTQFSNVTMTLYTVSGGNTRMTKIGADQF